MEKDFLFPIPESNEKWYTIPYSQDGEYTKIEPDGEITLSFNGKQLFGSEDFDEEHVDRFLSFVGEVDVPVHMRCEPNFPYLYRRPDDCLTGSEENLFLRLEGKNDKIRRAYTRLLGSELAGAKSVALTGTLDIKEGTMAENVYLLAEVYYKKNPQAYYQKDEADITVRLQADNKPGKQVLTADIQAEADIDFIMISWCADRFAGQIDFYAPCLTDESGRNYIPKFEKNGYELENGLWIGENISLVEQPLFTVSLNGQTILHDRIFDPISRWPAYEVSIPGGLLSAENNQVRIHYHRDFDGRPDFLFKEARILRVAGRTGIAAHERIAVTGQYIMLIRTLFPNTEVTASSACPIIVPEQELICFEEPGIHPVCFTVLPGGAVNTSVTVSFDGNTYTADIDRVVERGEDGVITGSSDSIFIKLEKEAFSRFVLWHCFHELGDLITLRTSYRWSGTIEAGAEFWRFAEKLLSSTGKKFAVMLDGRELPSCENKPDISVDSPAFLGYQTHEEDGAFDYWTPSVMTPRQQLFFEIFAKRTPDDGIYPKWRGFERDGEAYWRCLNPNQCGGNMRLAAERFVDNLRASNIKAARHSGPSVLFKYFFQAGLSWLCAETMYGPLEVILAALRGVSHAYGVESFGVHHAVQWSTHPHDEIYRYRRFWLALMTSYTQGVTQINTEEGFYCMDSDYTDFKRESDGCAQHRAIQTVFNRFVRSHTRRGKPITPFALVQGRYDGFCLFGFGDENVWNLQGTEWQPGAPEHSWELTKIFYPQSQLKALYFNPCPREPVGYHTGMPYGQADIIPAESPNGYDPMYRTLAYLGWNTAREEDIPKLTEFVQKGGTVVLGWPHLYTTENRIQGMAHQSDVLFNEEVSKLLGISGFSGRNSDGTGQVTLSAACFCGKEYGAQKDDEVICNALGQGRVLLVNRFAYPAEEAVSKIFDAIIRRCAETVIEQEQGKGWITAAGAVNTAAFEESGTRVFYCNNINWWSDEEPEEAMTLHWGGKRYNIVTGRDAPYIVTVGRQQAVMTCDLQTDVMRLCEDSVILQGAGEAVLTIFSPCKVTVSGDSVVSEMWKKDRLEVRLALTGIHTVTIENITK